MDAGNFTHAPEAEYAFLNDKIAKLEALVKQKDEDMKLFVADAVETEVALSKTIAAGKRKAEELKEEIAFEKRARTDAIQAARSALSAAAEFCVHGEEVLKGFLPKGTEGEPAEGG